MAQPVRVQRRVGKLVIRSAAVGAALAAAVVAAAIVVGGIGAIPERPSALSSFVPAGAPLPMFQADLTSDPTDLESYVPAIAPPNGAFVEHGTIRIPAPKPPPGPRRVAIQVGHWQTDAAPPELYRLVLQTGASWEGINEVDVNLDIAQRVATHLRSQGIVVDVLPVTIPPGYVADAFLALHADSDGVGELSGFKLVHGPDRGPVEDALVAHVREAYAKATGLAWDGEHISPTMRYYYPFNWARYQHAAAPHTPAAILEMGYVSNDDDRALLTDRPEVVAGAIAAGLARFLDETPRERIFGSDLAIPSLPPRTPPPSATP